MAHCLAIARHDLYAPLASALFRLTDSRCEMGGAECHKLLRLVYLCPNGSARCPCGGNIALLSAYEASRSVRDCIHIPVVHVSIAERFCPLVSRHTLLLQWSPATSMSISGLT